MVTYVCPRCKGNDVYFGTREQTTGIGGIYGRKTRKVKLPLCRTCAELMDEIKEAEDEKSTNIVVIGTVVVFGLFLLALVLDQIWQAVFGFPIF